MKNKKHRHKKIEVIEIVEEPALMNSQDVINIKMEKDLFKVAKLLNAGIIFKTKEKKYLVCSEVCYITKSKNGGK